MKKTLICLIVGAALVLPTSAFAHDGWKHGHHHGNHFFAMSHHHNTLFAKLSGTGTSFSGSTATASGTISKGSLLSTGTFNASLTTNWSAATSKTFDKGTLSCAPSTASVSVASGTDTVSSSLTGKTCSFTKTDGTVIRAFFGHGTADGAGTLASLDGNMSKLWLVQKADGSVMGATWVKGDHENATMNSLFVKGEREAEHSSGCDH
jgi:hypothetical protein